MNAQNEDNTSENRKLVVFTDGGAKNNGKRNCTAAWAVFFDDETGTVSQRTLERYNESGKIYSEPSNQKAELYAINKALEKATHIVQNRELPLDTLQIVTDSQYSIDCLTKWCKNWEKNGWRTYKGEKVKHDSIIKESLKSIQELQRWVSIEWKHVNSHLIAPKNPKSIEYILWYGNYKVDKMVSSSLSQSQTHTFNMPKGKAIAVDWDGSLLPDNVKPAKKKKEKDDDSSITVNW